MVYQLQCKLFKQFKEEEGIDTVNDPKLNDQIAFEDFIGGEYQSLEWLSKHLPADEAVFLANHDGTFPTEDISEHQFTDGRYVVYDGNQYVLSDIGKK